VYDQYLDNAYEVVKAVKPWVLLRNLWVMVVLTSE
jgi:hypothetical protein